MLSEVTLHLFMVSRGIGINLNLLEINLVNTLILDVGLFYVLGDVLGGLLNDRLKALLSELFQRKERYLVSFYKLVRAGKVVSFSCVESWRIVYGESVIRMAIKAKILATSQLLKEFQPHVKTVSPGLKRFMNSVPVWAYDSATVMKKSYPAGDGLIDDESEVLGFGPLSPYTFGSLFINLGHGGHRTALSLPYIKFDAKVLPGFGPLYANKYPQTQDECRYVLRKLACRQVEGMPAYRVAAMSDDSKQLFTKEYRNYLSKKYDRCFITRYHSATSEALGFQERLPGDIDSLVKEAMVPVFDLQRHMISHWKRFLRPEWAMSVVSAGGTCCARIHLCPSIRSEKEESLLPKDCPRDIEASFVWLAAPRPWGGEIRHPGIYRKTRVHFSLEDGQVHKYFSGRMLSLVVSSLSRC